MAGSLKSVSGLAPNLQSGRSYMKEVNKDPTFEGFETFDTCGMLM
jgi:hypothetical protein